MWRSYAQLAAAKRCKPKTLYFHAGGKLSFDAPAEQQDSDEYVSDPAHPVPFVGYTTDTVPQRYMVDDQRFASRRPDVLVYQTEPLEEDVTIAGPVSPKLKVSTTGTDSDFVVKLIDVYPNDYPDPATDEQRQARARCAAAPHGRLPAALARRADARQVPQQLGEPEPFAPGKMAEVNFAMPDLEPHLPPRPPHHGAGAELLVPARRSQPADLHGYSARQAGRLHKATERVFHSADAASGVEVWCCRNPECRVLCQSTSFGVKREWPQSL